MNNIAFYIRLSESDIAVKKGLAEESNSITSQRKLLYNFIKGCDEFSNSNVTEYFDDGTSGTLFAKRDRFQDMVQAAQNGEIDCIIVKDLSRFGRDYLEVGYYTEILFPMLGVRFISVNDNFDTKKLNGATGGMEFALKNLMHQLYSADISKKIKTARRARNKLGQYTSGAVPYGYKKDPKDKHKLIVDSKCAKIVKEIFDLSAKGLSYREIALTLNTRGISKKNTSPNPVTQDLWFSNDIAYILKNEIYIGRLIQNKTESAGFGDSKKLVKNPRERWVIVEDAVQPIIDKVLFEQINARFGKTRKSAKRTNKINLFVCPYCGHKLTETKNKNSRLQCGRRGLTENGKCNNINCYAADIKEKVLEAVNAICKIAVDKSNLQQEQREEALKSLKLEHSRLNKEKTQLTGKPTMLYFDFKAGRMTQEEFIAAKEAVNNRLSEIDVRLAEIEREMSASNKPSVNIDDVSKCGALQTYDSKILAKLIQKIYVYEDGNIEIVFDCKDFFQSCMTEN